MHKLSAVGRGGGWAHSKAAASLLCPASGRANFLTETNLKYAGFWSGYRAGAPPWVTVSHSAPGPGAGGLVLSSGRLLSSVLMIPVCRSLSLAAVGRASAQQAHGRRATGEEAAGPARASFRGGWAPWLPSSRRKVWKEKETWEPTSQGSRTRSLPGGCPPPSCELPARGRNRRQPWRQLVDPARPCRPTLQLLNVPSCHSL